MTVLEWMGFDRELLLFLMGVGWSVYGVVVVDLSREWLRRRAWWRHSHRRAQRLVHGIERANNGTTPRNFG